MPGQKPISASSSRSYIVRCSRRCASSSRFSVRKNSSRSFSSSRMLRDRDFHPIRGRHVMRRRIDRDALQLADHLAAQRIDLVQRLDLVAEELDAHRALLFVGRERSRRCRRARGTSRDGNRSRCAGTAISTSLRSTLSRSMCLPLFEEHHHLEVDFGLAEAVDARDRRDDQHVVALEQRLGRGMAQLVDLVVDARVLLDEGVGRGDVRLGLVVVVVGDEVADRVFGEQALELVVELRGERLVRRHHQRRPVHLRDHVGHREGLARAGDAEQHLMRHACR